MQLLLQSMPQLSSVKLSTSRYFGTPDAGEAVGNTRSFDLSDELARSESGQLLIPDAGDCSRIKLKLSSTRVRSAEIRLPPGKKALRTLELELLNVIPFGETKLITDGCISYSVRIAR